MHNSVFAIRMKNVSKVYKLFGSQRDQIINVLGLHRFGLKSKTAVKEYAALTDINLDVPRGHRIGIVGRNGAGKTTLLKLICGNFSPTSGEVVVNGDVQALMNVGLGFHPEFTGRENVEASLQYNGLSKGDYQAAIDDIIEFCELGDYLDQPFKSYSLGMQARLMFASATAIRPDILIVDEVLGAGDAYFVAKSKTRVEKLVNSGCTMLLVSHSMQQVMELCNEAIWLDKGKIRMHGDAFLVVKAYEEYLHGPIRQMHSTLHAEDTSVINLTDLVESVESASWEESALSRKLELPEGVFLQEPFFLPHSCEPLFPKYSKAELDGFSFQAPGGISRWESEKGVKLCGFSVVTERGISNVIVSMRPAKFVLTLLAEENGTYDCRYGILLNDHLGNCVARIYSPSDSFTLTTGEKRQVNIIMNPVQLGSGEYTIGISVLENSALEQLNSTRRFDLLGRSFLVRVELPESLCCVSANFMHTAEWQFDK